MKTVSFSPIATFALVLGLAIPATHAAPDALQNYEKHCRKCHGPDGKAQTRLGKKSGAPDLSDPARQAKLTDDDAFKGIKFGRKNAKGEEKMDAFGSDLTDPQITALVAYIRTFAK
jgi:mono/diheme cytochrome c family protein